MKTKETICMVADIIATLLPTFYPMSVYHSPFGFEYPAEALIS